MPNENEKTIESKVRKFPPYGGFAVELLKLVCEKNNLMFLEVWNQCFPNLSDTKAQQLAKKAMKKLDPRNTFITIRKTSGYRLYSSHRREEIKKTGEKFVFNEHNSLIAKEWDKLDDKSKKIWYDKADKENIPYFKQLNDVEEKIKNGELAESPFRKPDRPTKLNGFNMFCKMERDKCKNKNPDLDPSGIMKKLAQLWRDLDDDSKNEWKVKATDENKKIEDEFNNESHQTNEEEPEVKPKSKKANGKVKTT
jgi:hypothetical protein